MNLLNGKKVKQSFLKDFYNKHPSFQSTDNPLLHHRPAKRWFEQLEYTNDEDVYNFQEVMQGKSGLEVIIRDRPIKMMSSYDYLGLIGHAEIEAAAINAIHQFGTGTGGVRLLTGTNQVHCELEASISKFKGMEAAMVVSSGYMANLAAISGLFNKNDLVITDEHIHHSITDAIKVAGVQHVFFRHNDPASLKEILEKFAAVKRKLVVVEGVYSMDGDICPLPEIIQLKTSYNAFLMVDEAHSLGVLGDTGRGVNEYHDIDPSLVDIFTGSLSKTIPSNGGFIAAKEEVIVYLKHGGAPYMFSAALSPANTAAAIKALDIIDEEGWRIKKLWKNTMQLTRSLENAGINTGCTQSPVIPVICGTNERAFKFSKDLFDRGFLANAVIYPAVPINKARLRLCCTASHTPEVLEDFVAAAASVYKQL